MHMRIILLGIFALLINYAAKGQGKPPIGGTATDTAWIRGSLQVDKQLRFPLYAPVSDTSYFGIATNGRVYSMPRPTIPNVNGIQDSIVSLYDTAANIRGWVSDYYLNKNSPDGTPRVEVNNTGFTILSGGLNYPYLPVARVAGEYFAPVAGYGYPTVSTINAKFRLGVVPSIAALLEYDGIENIVYHKNALFRYDATLPHTSGANNQYRFFTNTGKNDAVGGWVLQGNGIVYAEWFYDENTDWFLAIQKATAAAGVGGVVVYPNNIVVEQTSTLQVETNQTHLMNGSTLKLPAVVHVTLAADAPVGSTVLKVLGSIPSYWGAGKKISLYYGDSESEVGAGGLLIDHVSNDSIYLNQAITARPGGTSWLVGDFVTSPFLQISEGDFPVTFINGSFDGSSDISDTVNYHYTQWTTSLHSQARFENVHFKNVIGDVLIGHRIKAINCTFKNISGAILHTSGLASNSYGFEPNLLQNCDGRNIGLVAPEVSGHQEGKGAVVTHSATPGNYVIDNCRFYGANSLIPAPIGSFNANFESATIIAPQDVLIKNSYFEGWGSIVYKYGGTDAGCFTARIPGYSKIDRIFFTNNVFHDMDTSDYSNQAFFGDTAQIGTVKFVGNAVSGNTEILLCPATANPGEPFRYTPSGSAAAGYEGIRSYDDSYEYIYQDGAWKRVAKSTF